MAPNDTIGDNSYRAVVHRSGAYTFFSQIINGRLSSNALYSASLSFMMFIFLLTHKDSQSRGSTFKTFSCIHSWFAHLFLWGWWNVLGFPGKLMTKSNLFSKIGSAALRQFKSTCGKDTVFLKFLHCSFLAHLHS